MEGEEGGGEKWIRWLPRWSTRHHGGQPKRGLRGELARRHQGLRRQKASGTWAAARIHLNCQSIELSRAQILAAAVDPLANRRAVSHARLVRLYVIDHFGLRSGRPLLTSRDGVCLFWREVSDCTNGCASNARRASRQSPRQRRGEGELPPAPPHARVQRGGQRTPWRGRLFLSFVAAARALGRLSMTSQGRQRWTAAGGVTPATAATSRRLPPPLPVAGHSGAAAAGRERPRGRLPVAAPPRRES